MPARPLEAEASVCLASITARAPETWPLRVVIKSARSLVLVLNHPEMSETCPFPVVRLASMSSKSAYLVELIFPWGAVCFVVIKERVLGGVFFAVGRGRVCVFLNPLKRIFLVIKNHTDLAS